MNHQLGKRVIKFQRSNAETILEKMDADLKRVQSSLRREITRRRKLQKALEESEERYRTIVEMQSELICRYSPDLTLTYVNEAYCKYFGKTREELIGKNLLMLLPETEHEACIAHVRKICETPHPLVYEHTVIGRGGEIRWQQWVDQVLLNDDGSIRELQAVGRDITSRKEAEEEYRQKQQENDELRARYERLTPREKEVMTLVVDGRRNREIAATTGITERTIKYHRHQIMERMEAKSLAELVRMAEKLDGLDLHSNTQGP